MPFSDHIGVSQRIETQDERTRLLSVTRNDNATSGYIARTTSTVSRRGPQPRYKFLRSSGNHGVARQTRTMPSIDLLRSQRRFESSEISSPSGSVEVDEIKTHREIGDFVEVYAERLLDVRYLGQHRYSRSLASTRRSSRAQSACLAEEWQLCVIDETEALTVVDVNSGKFVGKRNPEERSSLSGNARACVPAKAQKYRWY